MAIAANNSRAGRRFSALNWRRLRQRLIPLLLLAFFCEVTLPYQADCPLYHAGHGIEKIVASGAQATDVDKSGLFHNPFSGVKNTGQDKKPVPETCSLCALTANFAGAVAAGLIALPPPPIKAAASFSFVDSDGPALAGQRGFSARAPPAFS